MDDIRSFIAKNYKNYLPRKYKNRLQTFIDVDSSFNFFLVEDTQYFIYVALVYLFGMCKENFDNDLQINWKDVPVDTFFASKSNFYKYIKTDNNFVELSDLSEKNGSLTNSYPIEAAKDALVIKTCRPRKKQQENDKLLEQFAKELGTKKANKNFFNYILVVCSKKLREQIENTSFSISGRQTPFAELCSAVSFTKYGESYSYLKHSTGMDLPIAVFTGGLEKAVEILQNSELISNFSEISAILIMGDNYLNNYHQPEMMSVKILAEEKNIPVSIYASSNNIFKKDVGSFILRSARDTAFYGILPSELGLDKKIAFEEIFTNQDFNENMDKLNEFIEEINKIPRLYGLLIRAYKFRFSLLSRFYRNETTQSYLIKLLSELINSFKAEGFQDEGLEKALFALTKFRYPENVKKKILKLLKKDSQRILVVEEVYVDTAKSMLQDMGLANKVISTKETPDEMIYPNGKFVMQFTSSKNYFKWFCMFQGEELICLYPSYQKSYFSRLLQYVTFKVSEFDKVNKVGRFKDLSIPQNWNLSLPEEVREEIIALNGTKNPDSDIVEISIKDTNQLIDKINEISIEQTNDEQTNWVEIKYAVTLNEDVHIFATENFDCSYIDENDKIASKRIDHFDEEEEILNMVFPYANDLYYDSVKEIKNLHYKPYDEYTKFEKDVFLDWYWKDSLRRSVKKRGIGLNEVTNIFGELGFVRSPAFFQQWLDPNRKLMVPNDIQFIKYVGIFADDQSIKNNYESYYRSSVRLKNTSKKERSKILNDIIGMPIRQLKHEFPQISYYTETIITINKIEGKKMKRQYTNKVLKREDVLFDEEFSG
ncbi:hypothetical protein FQS87_20950 [Enterococcus avium]|uniref:hypothetical protein n=1 Tax=Enterococcus avium TaxID=33945 RepID=UPI001A970FA5|nr:hypothetical protein [Enterococcus avium]MBO1142357.1 hypothetical protein [Enterococcus avium]